MILLALAAAAAIEGTPLGVLAPQALPIKGCAAYLFTADGTRRFVAMAGPESLRVVIDGATVDAAAVSRSGAVTYDLTASTEYRRAGLVAALDLTVAPRADLSAGATIPEATLRLDRDGADSAVIPLVGLIGCKT